MRVLVTGITGQLGFDVMSELSSRNIQCVGAGRSSFDITNSDETSRFIFDERPDAVIHCAAYTAVDKAESESDFCRAVNVEGSANVAQACEKIGAKLICISTDYVFGGSGSEPMEPDFPKAPLNVYGRTKLEGEMQVLRLCSRAFIVRTSWVYGMNGGNFVKTMLRLGDEKETINVVSDQIGSPTYTKDLAVLLCDMVITERYGIYHATNEGYCSWAEFAQRIMSLAGKKTVINPIPSSEYPTAAVRPLNSRLSKSCLDANGFNRMPRWEDALERFINEIKD